MGANAQTSVPVFTAGQILTAQQQTEINTGIPVFATTTTRDAAFGGTGEKTLAEGQFAYIEATNTTQYYDGAAWQSVGNVARVAQVLQSYKTDTFSSSSTTFTDITTLSVSITPSATTSKILVTGYVNANGVAGQGDVMLQIVRGVTAIGNADTAGNRSVGFGFANAGNGLFGVIFMYLDSPSTTSATTYKIQGRLNAGAGTWYVNRTPTDTDNAGYPRVTSSITVMEVTV